MIAIGIAVCLFSILVVILAIASDISDDAACAISSLMGFVLAIGAVFILCGCGVIR